LGLLIQAGLVWRGDTRGVWRSRLYDLCGFCRDRIQRRDGDYARIFAINVCPEAEAEGHGK
jgi:hypothetical protein